MKTAGIRKWAAPARGPIAILSVTLLALLLAHAPASAAPPDKREMRAREAYAAGQYKEALDLYVKLYAEKLHPTYLRNIGRCYQLLGEPDKAISSFHEYLHKAKSLTSSERAEVEGYIHDMEALKSQGGAKAPGDAQARTAPGDTRPPPATATTTTPTPPPAAVEPKGDGAAPVLIAQPAAAGKESQEESPAFYKRWWFWTAVGVVAVAGAVVVATGALNRNKDAACDTTRSCM